MWTMVSVSWMERLLVAGLGLSFVLLGCDSVAEGDSGELAFSLHDVDNLFGTSFKACDDGKSCADTCDVGACKTRLATGFESDILVLRNSPREIVFDLADVGSDDSTILAAEVSSITWEGADREVIHLSAMLPGTAAVTAATNQFGLPLLADTFDAEVRDVDEVKLTTPGFVFEIGAIPPTDPVVVQGGETYVLRRLVGGGVSLFGYGLMPIWPHDQDSPETRIGDQVDEDNTSFFVLRVHGTFVGRAVLQPATLDLITFLPTGDLAGTPLEFDVIAQADVNELYFEGLPNAPVSRGSTLRVLLRATATDDRPVVGLQRVVDVTSTTESACTVEPARLFGGGAHQVHIADTAAETCHIQAAKNPTHGSSIGAPSVVACIPVTDGTSTYACP